jgi:small subunit ribosomal protein S19
MSRSLKKGPFVDEKLLKKLARHQPGPRVVVNTWSRSSIITPEMLGYTIGVHNGKIFIPVSMSEEMVGHRLGEFSKSRTFVRHGGKMQKEQEAKAKAAQQGEPAPRGEAGRQKQETGKTKS